jgi:hypothetical protein
MKMLSVKFKSPIVIDEKNLGALLSLAGVAAEVEPYVDGAKVRKPRAAAAPAPEPTSEPEPQASTPVAEPVKEKAKPGRPKKVVEEAKAEEGPAADDGGEEVDAGTLLNRFSSLIDNDFEGAKDLLDNFGVAKFSDLPESEFLAFSQKLSELDA